MNNERSLAIVKGGQSFIVESATIDNEKVAKKETVQLALIPVGETITFVPAVGEQEDLFIEGSSLTID